MNKSILVILLMITSFYCSFHLVEQYLQDRMAESISVYLDEQTGFNSQ